MTRKKSAECGERNGEVGWILRVAQDDRAFEWKRRREETKAGTSPAPLFPLRSSVQRLWFGFAEALNGRGRPSSTDVIV